MKMPKAAVKALTWIKCLHCVSMACGKVHHEIAGSAKAALSTGPGPDLHSARGSGGDEMLAMGGCADRRYAAPMPSGRSGAKVVDGKVGAGDGAVVRLARYPMPQG